MEASRPFLAVVTTLLLFVAGCASPDAAPDSMADFAPVTERPAFLDPSYEIVETDQVEVVLTDGPDIDGVSPIRPLPDDVNSWGTEVDVVNGWLRLETAERFALVEGRHNTEDLLWSTLCIVSRQRDDGSISVARSCADKAALGSARITLGTDTHRAYGNVSGGYVIVNQTTKQFAYGTGGLFAIPASSGDDVVILAADGSPIDDVG